VLPILTTPGRGTDRSTSTPLDRSAPLQAITCMHAASHCHRVCPPCWQNTVMCALDQLQDCRSIREALSWPTWVGVPLSTYLPTYLPREMNVDSDINTRVLRNVWFLSCSVYKEYTQCFTLWSQSMAPIELQASQSFEGRGILDQQSHSYIIDYSLQCNKPMSIFRL